MVLAVVATGLLDDGEKLGRLAETVFPEASIEGVLCETDQHSGKINNDRYHVSVPREFRPQHFVFGVFGSALYEVGLDGRSLFRIRHLLQLVKEIVRRVATVESTDSFVPDPVCRMIVVHFRLEESRKPPFEVCAQVWLGLLNVAAQEIQLTDNSPAFTDIQTVCQRQENFLGRLDIALTFVD